MSGRMSTDRRAMLLGAAQASQRGSFVIDEGSAESAAQPVDEEAGMIGEAAPSHDVSVMPTVAENRQQGGAALSEAAETKTETEEAKEASGEGIPGSIPPSTSSLRFRNLPLARADEPPPPASPYATSSSGGFGGAGGSGVKGSSKGSVASSSSGHGGNPILAMFKKASTGFSYHNALSLSHNHGGHGHGGGGHGHGHNAAGGGHHRHGRVMPARGKLTEEDEAMLSDSEADYDAFDDHSERAHKKLLSPNFRFFRWYTTYMLLVLLAFVFYMPIRIAFFPREGGAWSGVDLMWNILFAIDVVIHLNTGFVDSGDGTVVYDRAAIFWRYAKGWLLVDLLAAFPFTFIPGLGPEDTDGNHEVAHLLSLPKMFRVYWLMTVVQENHRVHEGAFMAVRTLLSVVVTAQLFGCGWYMLATLLYTECEDLYFSGLPEEVEFISANGLEYSASDYIGSECSWIYRNDYAALSVGRRYLGSVYWALTTLTTVGYGDLSARTTAEQIYSMAVQIVGVSWYGYIVGTWASVLNSFDREDKEQRSKLREVVAFSKAVGLPPDIAKKVRQHFRFALYRQDNWIAFNEQELVSDMPLGLRADVITHVHMSTIAQIPWLEGKEKAFVADVAIALKPRLFMNGDALYRRGAKPEEMFFIASGVVMVKFKHHRVGFLRQGQMAGLIGLVSCEKHKVTAVAQREVHCFGMSHGNFLELMETYPREMQELVDAAKNLAQRVALSSSEARGDLMSNEILANLISKPKALTGAEGVGDRWTELQHDSVGHTEEDSRKSLPTSFSRPPPAAAAAAAAAAPQQQQQRQRQSSFGGSLPQTSHSETDAVPPASAPLPTSLSMGSMPHSAAVSDDAVPGGTGGGGGGTVSAIEDAVGREVSKRLSAVEDRLGAVMERLEGFLDSAEVPSEK